MVQIHIEQLVVLQHKLGHFLWQKQNLHVKKLKKKIESLLNLNIFRRDLPDLLEIPEVIEIGQRLGKTPAQILLKWILERGVAAIPKSTNAGRLQQNLDLFDFELTTEDMAKLNGLDEGIRIVNFEFFKG